MLEKSSRLEHMPGLPAYAKKWIIIDLLGSVAGLAGGLGAVFFRFLIDLNNRFFFDKLLPYLSVDLGRFNLGLIILPALGGACACK